ncbi:MULTISPECIES: hypothetical protein [unclassified Streptomyces]|nr:MULTISPECIES: hypothetical protein [unclassified Streptomyces]
MSRDGAGTGARRCPPEGAGLATVVDDEPDLTVVGEAVTERQSPRWP